MKYFNFKRYKFSTITKIINNTWNSFLKIFQFSDINIYSFRKIYRHLNLPNLDFWRVKKYFDFKKYNFDRVKRIKFFTSKFY